MQPAKRYKSRRYAYIKSNNSVRELARLAAMRDVPDGGPEAYIANFLGLAERDPVLIVTFHSVPRCDEQIAYNENCNATSYFWRHGVSGSTILSRLRVCIGLLVKLVAFRPTHILCWQSNLPLWICWVSSKALGARFVASRHGRFPDDTEPLHRKLTGAIDKWVVRHASAVVCHGPYLADELRHIGVPDEKIVEFNWGYRQVVQRVRDASSPDLTENGNCRLLLYVGRILRQKGVFDLLDASKARLKRDPALKLVFAGDGPERQELMKKIETLGLREQVISLGHVPHDRLGDFIEQSYVVITPTRREYPEGRCMATIEALVLGIPVIAPDFGPFPYLVEHAKNGLLYPPDEIPELRRAVDRLLDDEQLYLRLRSGATETGRELVHPKRRFLEAVRTAFGMDEGDSRDMGMSRTMHR